MDLRRIYQTTTQRASGFAGPIVDTIKRPFSGIIDIVKSKFLGLGSVTSPISSNSDAERLVNLSRLDPIDDRECDLARILEDYAQNFENANIKDQDKISTTVVKLFDKMSVSQEPGTSDNGLYYKCVDVPSDRGINVTPESEVYEKLLISTDLRSRPHPLGISGLAFAFAAILALTLHREDTSQPDLKNETSPYFDLSPLYGVSDEETDNIRTKDGRGMLKPDTFTEKRLDMLPDSVPVLLVLWNRYHNYVAKQLMSYNEDNSWDRNPNDLSEEIRLTQDNQIFELARSITCIHFINIVKQDFLKGLIGIPIIGPSARVDILYDVRGMKNVKAGYLSTVESYLLYSFSSFTPTSFASERSERVKEDKGSSIDSDVKRNRFSTLGRNKEKHDRFDDNDLAELLFDAVGTHAGSPGDRMVPEWVREREIAKLKRARQTNVCTLNEFRRYLGLKPLESFREWNPQLAGVASGLYDNDINRLELYPGLLCECSDRSGFGFGYTMTWGLMADIVTRIRRDPVFMSDFNVHILTKWGYKTCMSDIVRPEETGSGFYHTAGSPGGTLSKLLQRTLPLNCPYDNVYCLFPFVVPEKSIDKIPASERKKFTVERPKQAKIKVLRTIDAISKVLNDPQTFPSPYKESLIELTGGYGHMLGFDDIALHDRDLMLTLFSLMPDKGAAGRIGAYFARKAQENLNRRSHCIDDERKVARIDVIKDVIDATCIRWVCETICNLRFKDDTTWGMSKEDKAQEESQVMEEKERENFASCYAYIFRNCEPEFGWNVREVALTASELLRKHLEKQIPRDKDQPSDTMLTGLRRFLGRLREEYTTGKMLPRHSPFTFLDRVVKKGHIRPLKELADKHDNLLQMKEEYKIKARREIEAESSKGLLKQTFPTVEPGIPKPVIDDIADRKLEEQRVIANVIGLGVVICMHFSKACAQAVDFYLDDKYSAERKELFKLCSKSNSSNEEIMGYIRKAQRIGQRFGLWRDVNLSSDCTMIIEQGSGYPDVMIEPGDRVFADFQYAHNDPKQIMDADKLNPDRKLNSLLGLGVHKCPAEPVIDQIMPPIFRVIFKQWNLKRVSGRKGQLNATTLHPHEEPWHSDVYLDENGGFTHYPKHMEIEFYARRMETKDWELKKDTTFEKHRLMMDRVLISIATVILLMIAAWYYYASSPLTPLYRPVLLNAHCAGPLRTIEDWHIKTFHPEDGLFGQPAPITYQTPWAWEHRSHQISVIDIDKRDLDLHVLVDNKDYIPFDVDLDSTVDCRDDIEKCLELNFSSAVVVVPPGRHMVKVEIRKWNTSESFDWGGESQKRIMWMVQGCA